MSLLWKWMIQIGKAGPLQSFELIYCIFKRDREQIWRKQTFQHVVSAGGDCWGYGSLQCAGFPAVGLLEQSSAEVCPAVRWCRCLCCFLWNQPVGVGAAAPGAKLCIPSPAKERSVRRSLWHSWGERRMQESNGDMVCWRGICSGP